MDLVPDDETEGFSFFWTIQNFSYCLQKKGEVLESPGFKLNFSDTSEWYVGLYPRGISKKDSIGLFLYVDSNGLFPIKVRRYFSIRAIDGIFYRRRNEGAPIIFEHQPGCGYQCFLNYRDLFKNKDYDFLKNDTLTLRCRILKEYLELPMSMGQSYARTVIHVKRIGFVCSVENFEELLKKKKTLLEPSCQIRSFTVGIVMSGEVYCERKVQVEIKLRNTTQKKFITCKLSLLDVEGKTAHSVQDDHWCDDSPETKKWNFTFMPVKQILDYDKLYLVNGTLSLSCEFAVSSGVKYSEMERIEYRVTDEPHKESYDRAVNTILPGCWKENLQHFYNEGKFSDLTIRTASNKEFPVHKAILCARSEVFSAMFEHDTKENRTSVVEIEDLNDDTVAKMLLFTYTDIVGDLQWDTASKLYFAADKYGIVGLKRECSTFLKENLNSSNVCEVLVLADMHQDQEMKSAVQDFIIHHATELYNSEYWLTFLQEKPTLAADTLQVLFTRMRILNLNCQIILNNS